MQRTIVHADLDAFYASVEQLDHEELRGRPVVVGGPAESRGVVAAASYEARRFGVRSAMPMSRALRLCPDAVRVGPRFARYGELSAQVMAIFRALTPLVEPLSLDEAYLDVSAIARDAGDGERIGGGLKRSVREATGLTLSVGVGTNKTVAKIASDLGKPDGLLVVPAGTEAAFLAPLPVRALWGVGPKTEALLTSAGIAKIGDLAERGATAARVLGPHGEALHQLARGNDERAVETAHDRKSVGAETTFANDLADGPELRTALGEIVEQVARGMARERVRARTVAIKLRYANFKTITRQTSLVTPADDTATLRRLSEQLLDRHARPGDRFRLLGMHCSNLVRASDAAQGVLWHGAGNHSDDAGVPA
ncbi:MAG TPA: DNA polymerase IV [Dehalococcoidia bacterium]|nr:DNA polymerase IV [Dehalococcoidia bacterium]